MTFSSSIERSTSIGKVEPSSVATVRCTIVGSSRLGEARVAGGRGFASEGESRWGAERVSRQASALADAMRAVRKCVAVPEVRKACAVGLKVEAHRCVWKFAKEREAATADDDPCATASAYTKLIGLAPAQFLSLCKYWPKDLALRRLVKCQFDWKDSMPRRYKRNQRPTPHNVFIFAATRKLFAICA